MNQPTQIITVSRSSRHVDVVAPELSRPRHKMSQDVTCQHNAAPMSPQSSLPCGQHSLGGHQVRVSRKQTLLSVRAMI